MDLVGRETELADVLERLTRRRLVTITGPGGIGKTVLAREVLERAPTVGMVVDLTRVDDPRAVAGAFAGQLGFHDLGALTSGWAWNDRLVFVDNCEHVLDAAAEVVARLLEVPDLPVLATSRTPLDLPGESVVGIGPLDSGDPRLEHSRAVFLGAVADSGVDSTGLDDDLVGEICRLADGVPLALEIAAARLRTMSLPELAESLRSDLGGLSRPRFRGRAAHQGVAELVDGSIRLLDSRAREVFESLGVFAGPFTSEAAAAVTERDRDDTRLALEELVAASLVLSDSSADGSLRLRMLHPVRAVAAARLRAQGRFERVQQRFVDRSVAAAVEIIERAHQGWDASVLGDLMAAYEDMAAALRWTIDHDEEPTRAFTLLAVLWGVLHQLHAGEVQTMGDAALERWPDPTTPGWGEVAATVATSAVTLGELDRAARLAGGALEHVPPASLAACTLNRALAQVSRAAGDLSEARQRFRAAAEIADALGAGGLALESMVGVGMLSADLGERAQALDVVETALRVSLESGFDVNAAWAAACRAALVLDDDPAAALPLGEEALDWSRRSAYPAGVAASMRVIAAAQLRMGDTPQAVATLLELLDELRTRNGLTRMRICLDLVAEVIRDAGGVGWADLAATGSSLPITTVITPVDAAVFRETSGRPLKPREAHRLAVDGLRAVLDSEKPPSRLESGPAVTRRGEVWSFLFEGREVLVKESKGVGDLVYLISHPGVDVPATDLMGALVAMEAGLEMIDDTARRTYTARLRELQAEIEEAEQYHDPIRADRARVEMDAIVDQLTAATGLGGRARRGPDPAERARSAVTHRLRSTITRVAELHPALGRHLERSVSTGLSCSYRPEPPVRWRVQA
ncbi:MAG TPA: AAA family ATPase [Acidimicrobiia bacterium]|nr:AAA family ATPase [Acidimicrobiia bacterium]